MKKIHLTQDGLAQGLHICLGALFLLIPAAKGWHHPRTTGLLYGILYATIKEFYVDIHYEDMATSGGWKGGLRDFSFYLIGMGSAWLLLL